MKRAPENTIELFHGYTYSAHPLACAAALASLDVYQEPWPVRAAREAWRRVWEKTPRTR